MIKDLTLQLPPEVAAQPHRLRQHILHACALQPQALRAVHVVRRSIDARQRQIKVNLTARLYIDEEPPTLEFTPVDFHPLPPDAPQAVVVGAGPAGLFAALRLIELGWRPVVLERGKDVHARRHDVAQLSRQQQVDPESNYAFGEGGAGAYSDGKLYTRSTKRGDVDRILRILCQHGADTAILADAHPHIGTDRLPAVIEAIRLTIQRCGGDVYFGRRVDALLIDRQRGRVAGVTCANGEEYQGPVILATGHSARDVYRLLHRERLVLETKGMALGVRVEHPSQLIDSIMYHRREGRGPWLPAAEYRLSAQVEGRGVYSFCMCPGGFVIPAASGPEQVVVNGMSPSHRGSRWSNAGLVVETRPEDLDEPSLHAAVATAMDDDAFAAQHADFDQRDHPLRMLYLQEALERACWLQGGRTQTAPAQRVTDFLTRRLGPTLPEGSYSAGLVASPLHFWLPEFLSSRLRAGLDLFGHRYRGFVTSQAQLIAIETRTSAPVRVVRHPEQLHHVDLQGLYPCGEGAGYAGGIVSAAIDGERCAQALAAAK